MILIATPSYGGLVTTGYMISLFNMVRELNAAGVEADIMTPSHESLITRARNHIANEFLRQEQYSHLLFIDADVGFEPDTGLRYLRADKDVACGIYPVKNLDAGRLRAVDPKAGPWEAEAAALNYTVKFRPKASPDADGFVSVEYGSTGFMLIRRAVLERMAQAYPELRYNYSYVAYYDHVHDNHAFFDTMIDPETRDYLPEDYAFCKRWTAIGGEVHADLKSRFTHTGTRVFHGDYPTFMHHAAKGD